jgi:virginiamycin B lyase
MLMKYLTMLVLSSLTWLLHAEPADLAHVTITEWPVPWENTRPRDPYVESEHRVWFVGQGGDYLAMLNPATSEFQRYDLEKGTGPHNLIVNPSGQVWFAGNLKGYIGQLDPKTGEIVKYSMPDRAATDPHTLVFDSQGNIWFTVQGGNFVGKLTTATGDIRLIRVPTPNARPYGIVVDGHDRLWFTEFGSNKLGTVDPATGQLHEFPLPREDARPRRLSVTSDGVVWYVDYAGGYLGHLDPTNGKVTEWRTPSGAGAHPYGMVVDGRDRLWLVETGSTPNRLVGFDPVRGKFFSSTAIPSGGGSVRHMFFHKLTYSLWFGTDTNTIARARVD